ncbi:tRNA (N6-isopentenyl adenosine(37)-C2)-methylthiotransferase MiaB [Turicimonas muris]|uniref:tRNA-2-methylthio-N(6)-dimethylallyladenosine synthase n=1 Tax=Turicimonas muris TaxID=1796652 RepID=A0A227KDU0_9BURK|nr:tRNA (N6-isopentenyl adenosine(37)-C2)-methylthiotransferase MiaB [Turicimonas muris]ANU66478.1 tRNA (N6-isopentenyl adenosine(37)-C2)-methylthiotransferase MiaB [Burkholderiales bacterium YL45]MBS4767625.1 tRNA (N6-isopentenyl adenosine(37)-C2)-methylthiotransferase MiaB [Burkholderiales bacterium]OXE45609.1 tRNA (N6-isopentenyl adenosine(37)-C2)-methylthiotransferase MiaB [Turicimonas muris]QQQ97626.1 tRNA (N6-isopentenyl adenosine(37)-C2)-methylthiotransferase MiaB [Turicimonas muris]
MNAKKIFIKTFGCQMNEYDSGKISDIAVSNAGYQPTDNIEEADLIVFNTCSIREKAQEKVFSDLGRARELKKEKPELKIAVGGCVASQEGKNIIRRAPYVDIVFGPQTYHRLPELLKKRQETNRPQVDISFPEIEKFDHLPKPHADAATAFVSIMEGCSKYCSYCVVPYTRGEEFSRPLQDVLLEIIQLAEQGVKEVTLLGQNVNAYRGEDPDGELVDFALLLEYVAEIEGIERIRYTTSHPKEFSKRLIEAYGKIPKLANHVHLPVQAGSDRVLAGMKRGYTVLEYKSIVRKLRQIRPDICIATDFIVGFPNETAEDFEKTMKLIEDVKFDASFSFVYSPRPGTPAAEMPDDTPQEVKLERLQRLQALNTKHAQEISQSMVGSIQRVLVVGKAKRGENMLSARTDNNRIVTFNGDESLIGKMISLKITDVYPHTLGGEIHE